MTRRVHVLGASGSGTSTLARNLATALGTQSFDTDDFYWRPTDPPFAEKRPVPQRLALMRAVFLPRSDWVLAGSFAGWGDAIVPRLTHVIFLTVPPAQRLVRLRRRERLRTGGAEGPRPAFLNWAMGYDDSGFPGRNRTGHEAWLAELTCPVIRLDGGAPPEALASSALAALDDRAQAS
ncbi:hypothetical protein DXV76_03815 [Rhodobacteraceae bacterium CCMM004]|nr:hypothetical protein DXV76_03815 [Rhodobacteraceae bacterium CCMM004]